MTGDFENPNCLQAIESIARACAGRQEALGDLQPRARLRRIGCEAGAASYSCSARTSTCARRHPRRQGALRRLLPASVSGGLAAMPVVDHAQRHRAGVGSEPDEFLAAVLLDRPEDAGRDAAVEGRAELRGNLGGDPLAGRLGRSRAVLVTRRSAPRATNRWDCSG